VAYGSALQHGGDVALGVDSFAEEACMTRVALGLAMAIALACGSMANAQGLVIRKDLSLSLARTIAEGALDECQKQGFHTAVVVLDRSAQILVMMRDEAASPITLEMARRKAYTAKMFRSSSADWAKRTAEPSFAGQRDLAEVLALGGGVPVMVGTDAIGAVASSGSSPERDDACARAGIARVADALK
jgi:uncharacterized protein GlcG (DUF336 family)